MSSNKFHDVRELLLRLHEAVGGDGLVGFALSGDTLIATHAKPGSGKPMLVINFDGSNDLSSSDDGLIDEIAAGSKSYFATEGR